VVEVHVVGKWWRFKRWRVASGRERERDARDSVKISSFHLKIGNRYLVEVKERK